MNTTKQAPEEVKQETPVVGSPAPEKKTMTPKSRNALLRYITILFAVAFLVVTLSLVISTKKSQSTITALNQTSASALENAEQLQAVNRELSDANESLREKIEDLESKVKDAEDEAAQAQEELEQIKSDAANAAKAYDLLLTAMQAQQSGDTAAYEAAMQQLEPLKDYLKDQAAELYMDLAEA